jgi:hypothetical protein
MEGRLREETLFQLTINNVPLTIAKYEGQNERSTNHNTNSSQKARSENSGQMH